MSRRVAAFMVVVLLLFPAVPARPAVFCDGVDDEIALDDFGLNGASRATFAAWIYVEDIGTSEEGYFGKADSTVAGVWAGTLSTGRLQFNLGGANSYGEWTQALNTWEHWVIVYDGNVTGNAERVRIWKDGVETAAAAFVGTIAATIPSSTPVFKVCTGSRVTTNFARVRLANLMVWAGTALTLGEAASQYLLPVPITTTNLRAWLRFEGTGQDLGANFAAAGQPGVGPTVGVVTGALPSFGPPITHGVE